MYQMHCQQLSLYCYENNAIWWRHLAPEKVAPILNAPMDWRQKLIDCNTVSDGYFDTLQAFVDALFGKILDLEGARPKTKGHRLLLVGVQLQQEILIVSLQRSCWLTRRATAPSAGPSSSQAQSWGHSTTQDFQYSTARYGLHLFFHLALSIKITFIGCHEAVVVPFAGLPEPGAQVGGGRRVRGMLDKVWAYDEEASLVRKYFFTFNLDGL